MKFTVKNFEKEWKRLLKEREAVQELQGEIKVQVLKQDLIAATPIDTGEARSGWSSTKTSYGWSITNRVNHIVFLNEGSSQQASPYFIERIALKYGKPVGTILNRI